MWTLGVLGLMFQTLDHGETTAAKPCFLQQHAYGLCYNIVSENKTSKKTSKKLTLSYTISAYPAANVSLHALTFVIHKLIHWNIRDKKK